MTWQYAGNYAADVLSSPIAWFFFGAGLLLGTVPTALVAWLQRRALLRSLAREGRDVQLRAVRDIATAPNGQVGNPITAAAAVEASARDPDGSSGGAAES